jgi:CubicO group peptidase (beta-lactamase class C family)
MACLTALVFASACSSDRGTGFDPAPLDATLKAFVDEGRAAGVSALIYKDDREVYFGAFGMRDREAGAPMTRDAIVQIQSMTKPVTGVALMQLYDDGALKLDDPIADYAAEFADLKVWTGFSETGEALVEEPRRAPTIRDLTRHTSGFFTRGHPTPLAKALSDVHPIDRNNTLAEFAQKLGTVPLLFQPGERIVYGYSVDVQAFLIERISGQPYDDYLRARILEPLGMADTDYYVPEEKRSRVAAVYEDRSGAVARESDDQTLSGVYRRWPLTPGGHGLVSTIDDYMRFARTVANGGALGGVQLLAPATARMMCADQLPETVTDRSWPSADGDFGWGINVAVRTAPPKSAQAMFGVVGEYGWEGALGTLFWIDPANDLIAIFFVQLASPAGELHKEFRDAVYAGIGASFQQQPR